MVSHTHTLARCKWWTNITKYARPCLHDLYLIVEFHTRFRNQHGRRHTAPSHQSAHCSLDLYELSSLSVCPYVRVYRCTNTRTRASVRVSGVAWSVLSARSVPMSGCPTPARNVRRRWPLHAPMPFHYLYNYTLIQHFLYSKTIDPTNSHVLTRPSLQWYFINSANINKHFSR